MRRNSVRAIFAVIVLANLVACSRNASKPTGRMVEPGGPTEGSVGFDIAVDNRSERQQWVATYASGRKTAKFRIELGPNKPGGDKDFPISFGNGRFLAEPGSDASVLLIDLKRALEAKTIPQKVGRVAELPFEFAILGEKQSRSSDGGFSQKPSGDWTAMKIFLAKGEGEVFVNFNLVAGKGEFSIKDADYGDIVLSELAKVL